MIACERHVLLAADGMANARIAERTDATVTRVLNWRGRRQDRGIAGAGRCAAAGSAPDVGPPQDRGRDVEPPPKKLGVTHWSTRLLAQRLKVSPSVIARAWRAYGVKPWKAESFRFSTDPELDGKVTDVCGLYLGVHEHVPESAIVLCVDKKSQIKALDRTVADPADAGSTDRAPLP